MAWCPECGEYHISSHEPVRYRITVQSWDQYVASLSGASAGHIYSTVVSDEAQQQQLSGPCILAALLAICGAIWAVWAYWPALEQPSSAEEPRQAAQEIQQAVQQTVQVATQTKTKRPAAPRTRPAPPKELAPDTKQVVAQPSWPEPVVDHAALARQQAAAERVLSVLFCVVGCLLAAWAIWRYVSTRRQSAATTEAAAELLLAEEEREARSRRQPQPAKQSGQAQRQPGRKQARSLPLCVQGGGPGSHVLPVCRSREQRRCHRSSQLTAGQCLKQHRLPYRRPLLQSCAQRRYRWSLMSLLALSLCAAGAQSALHRHRQQVRAVALCG